MDFQGSPVDYYHVRKFFAEYWLPQKRAAYIRRKYHLPPVARSTIRPMELSNVVVDHGIIRSIRGQAGANDDDNDEEDFDDDNDEEAFDDDDDDGDHSDDDDNGDDDDNDDTLASVRTMELLSNVNDEEAFDDGDDDGDHSDDDDNGDDDDNDDTLASVHDNDDDEDEEDFSGDELGRKRSISSTYDERAQKLIKLKTCPICHRSKRGPSGHEPSCEFDLWRRRNQEHITRKIRPDNTGGYSFYVSALMEFLDMWEGEQRSYEQLFL